MGRRKKLVGYDLDGVIAPKREGRLLDFIWWVSPVLGSFVAHYRLPKPLRIPDPKGVIITGRCGKEYEETLRWLKKHKINNALYMNSVNRFPDRQKAIDWKIMQINAMKVTKFYEDDPTTIKQLREKTEAKIIQITKTI